MKTLTFNAPRSARLLPDGKDSPPVTGGDTFTVNDHRALELLTDPALDVTEAAAGLADLSRAELDELAADAGLDPSTLPNKAAVVAALESPEADGAGQLEPEPETEAEEADE